MKYLVACIKVIVLLAALVVVAYALTTLARLGERIAAGEFETIGEHTFYDTSTINRSDIKAGKLLRQQKLESAPDGSVGWRVLYGS